MLVEKALYWGPVDSVEEGQYLCAILNSDRFAEAVRPLQARGQHNPRHFDMHIFAVAFPLFDSSAQLHMELVGLAERAEALVASLEFDSTRQFQQARREVREALREEGISAEIDQAVSSLLLQPLNRRSRRTSVSESPLDALPGSRKDSKRARKTRKTQRVSSPEKAKSKRLEPSD